MQLSAIVAEIQDEINKGSAVTDAQVRTHVQGALALLEMETDWYYMHQFSSGTIDADGVNPRRISLPSRPKKLDALRITKEDGKFKYLDEVEYEDLTEIKTKEPTGYYREGTSYLWLDNTPIYDHPYEIAYWGFTTWSDADTFEPWLFDVAQPTVKYNALVLLSSFLREPELGQQHAAISARALEAALNMNENFVYGNMPIRMGFGHE